MKCALPGCTAPRTKANWCTKHYRQCYTLGAACQVPGCEKRPRSKVLGLCEMHYYRARRHGSVHTVIDTRRPDAGYRAAHARIATERGPAREHLCIDCGAPAQHWSYRHDDPDERESPGGQPYSLSPDHYDPRCAACHAIFDGIGANQYTSTARTSLGGWHQQARH